MIPPDICFFCLLPQLSVISFRVPCFSYIYVMLWVPGIVSRIVDMLSCIFFFLLAALKRDKNDISGMESLLYGA